jgi:hypothetical protein
LEFSDDFRPQHFEVVYEYHHLWISTVITVHRKIAIRPVGHVIRASTFLKHSVCPLAKLAKNSSLRTIALALDF